MKIKKNTISFAVYLVLGLPTFFFHSNQIHGFLFRLFNYITDSGSPLVWGNTNTPNTLIKLAWNEADTIVE
jgi:hypothetical protein